MNRRSFLKGSLVAGAAAATGPLVQGCATVPRRPDGSPEPQTIDRMLEQGARTMWVAPHPDDESFAGSILAKSSIRLKNPLYFLVLTHDDGAECCLREGCPDMPTLRGQEMAKAAETYHAELQNEYFWDAPLPVKSFPKRHEMWEIWRKKGDPVAVAAKAIRRFRPDLLLTLEPTHGYTGHPEHQLASRVATAGIRLAADPAADLDGLAPHRTPRTYYVLNRFWVFVLIGQADPPPVTETFDATQHCIGSMTCQDFMSEATRAHRSQESDMSEVRYYRSAFKTVHLRQVDPWTDIRPVDEKAR
jgi:LmbE family N-acetylglucosaminyl deacetylase